MTDIIAHDAQSNNDFINICDMVTAAGVEKWFMVG